MTPCNPCENGKCGSCVAERLETQGHIRNAKDHCGCAKKGHKNTLESKLPKVKSMFSKTKKEEEVVHVEQKIVTEEEIEVD